MTSGTETGWGLGGGPADDEFPPHDDAPESPPDEAPRSAPDYDYWAGEPVQTDVVPGRAARSRRQRPAWAGPVVVILAVTALAGGLRFWNLSFPRTYVFDEVYYAKDACFDAGFPYQECKLTSPGEQTITVHPPVGRWMIAAGEKLFGNTSFGWRVSSATAGTLTVTMLAILAYQLWGSVLWAGLAGLMAATESLDFVQSRISMLDIFVAFWVVAGFLFLVLDRKWIERRTPLPERTAMEVEMNLPPDRPPSPVFRPWRIAAGIALGAATATKWSGGPALLAGIVLAFAWERSRRAKIGLPHPGREAFRDESFGLFLFLVLLPVATYWASYTKWWMDHGWFAFTDWWRLQKGMAEFSLHLRTTHPYASPAWSWILLKRPVAYYYVCASQGAIVCNKPAEILGLGNPAVFWLSILTIPYALFAWIAKRDWRAGLIFVAVTFQYVPWFFAARTNFLFYMTPITPFLVLSLAYAARDLTEVRLGEERTRAFAPLGALIVAASVGVFIFFLPILTGRTISYAAWHARIWFGSWI
jgi:dolichyl-phosphate-mannose--protein O-mannosyl transferase